MTRQEAFDYRRKIETAAAQQSDELALQSVELFPKWEAGISVTAGDRYQYNSVLYRVVQSHTTQDDWTPDITPALWTVVSLDEWPEWVRPTSSESAYKKGDKVTYNGQHYISLIDANVWSPEEYPAGWELVA